MTVNSQVRVKLIQHIIYYTLLQTLEKCIVTLISVQTTMGKFRRNKAMLDIFSKYAPYLFNFDVLMMIKSNHTLM